MDMRPSRVLAKLRAGKSVCCAKANLADPRVIQIAGLCGFDCVWIDKEHGPNDWRDVENQVVAAKLHDLDTLVRVARGSYSDLILPLEMDATGIMTPHVMGFRDAQQIVRQTRFHPLGRRPLDGGNADGAFTMVPIEQYVRQANEQRFVVVQIEDPEPMAELDAIAEIPGIDMLFFGPGDYSQGIGCTGDVGNPRVVEARRRVAEVARRYGKFAGTVASPSSMKEIMELGYQFVNIAVDVLSLVETFRSAAEAFNALTRN
jgi:4-hydroxy-2-oxoheptanedioate aldolase